MTEEGYNGWSNYETWLLKLNLDNDQGTYNMMQDLVREYITGHSTPDAYDMGDYLEEQLAEIFFDEDTQIYHITDNWTHRDWQEINWPEIAAAYIEEAKEAEQ